MGKSLYEVIGVDPKADQAQITEVCVRLAEQYGPKARPNDPDAAGTFKAIEDAFEVLGNPEKRAAYDATIAVQTSKRRPRKWIATAIAVPLIAAGLASWLLPSIPKAIWSVMSQPSGASKEAQDALQALKRLQAATESGVTYADYLSRLGETWFAVKTYLSSAPASNNPAVAKAFASAMANYSKASRVWEVKLREPSAKDLLEANDREPSWARQLKQDFENLDDYIIPVFGSKKYDLDGAIQALWREASVYIGQLDKLVR